MKKAMIFICIILMSSQAHASLFDNLTKNLSLKSQHSGSSSSADIQLHDVFNTLFYGQENFVNDNELYNTGSLNFVYPDGEAWWGQSGEVFQVEMTYTGSPHQEALGIMQEMGKRYEYTPLVAFDPNTNKKYNLHKDDPDARLEVEGLNGFMWVDEIKKGNTGYHIYSDYAFNGGQKDLFMAFSITDSLLLDFYYDQYSYDEASRMDELWVIAFDDPANKRGDFTDLVAVISSGHTMSPVPIPGSVLLMAGGCSFLFFRRRQTSKKGNLCQYIPNAA